VLAETARQTASPPPEAREAEAGADDVTSPLPEGMAP